MSSILTTESGWTDGKSTTTWTRRPGLTRRQALAAGAVALSLPLAGCLETVRGRTDPDSDGVNWGPTYFGGDDAAFGYATRATSDGGSLLGGERQISGGDEDLPASAWLIKLDAEGAEEWDRIYDGDAIVDVIETDEEYVFVNTGPSRTDEAAGIQLIGVEKADGVERWSHTYETARQGFGASVVRTTDGGFLIGGSVASGAGTWDALVLKLDADGNEEWAYTYDGSNASETHAAIEADDGGYIFAGTMLSFAGDEDGLIGKVNADGTEEWVRTIGGPYNDRFIDIAPASGDEFLVAGDQQLADQIHNPWIVRVDSGGNEVWSVTYGDEGVARAIARAPNGEYVLGGRAVVETSDGHQDVQAWIAKISEDGTERWSRTFERGDEGVNAIDATEDRYLAVGFSMGEPAQLLAIELAADGPPVTSAQG